MSVTAALKQKFDTGTEDSPTWVVPHVQSESTSSKDTEVTPPYPNIVDARLSFENEAKWMMLKCPLCNANARSRKAGPQFFQGVDGFRNHLERIHPEHRIPRSQIRDECVDRRVFKDEFEAIRADYSSGEHRK